MALVNVDDQARGPAKATNDMAIGETLKGYVVGTFNTKHGVQFRFQQENGEVIALFLTKDLQYKYQDGKIVLGRYTEITKLTNKKGMERALFKVAQDADKTVALEARELDAAGITSDSGGTGAVSSIKAKAAKLAAQVK